MPKVFSWNGFRFHFYSDEGDPREPMHIHIERDDADCKFWLYPEIRLAYNHGFNARTVKQLTTVVEARRSDIERVWNDHFS
jgi:Domain of unknown function (DUF4160)